MSNFGNLQPASRLARSIVTAVSGNSATQSTTAFGSQNAACAGSSYPCCRNLGNHQQHHDRYYGEQFGGIHTRQPSRIFRV